MSEYLNQLDSAEIRSYVKQDDANESVLFTRELEKIKTRVYEVPRKPNKALDLFPISQDASPADKTITWREWDQVGTAVFLQDYFTEMPRADVWAVERSINVHSIGLGWQVSVQELRESQQAGKDITGKRGAAVRNAMDLKMNQLTWNGNASKNINGFIDYAGTNEYTVPADGTSTTKTFSTKTPDQIVRDLFAMETTIIENTNEGETPTTLLMPIATERLISTKRMTDGDKNTVKNFFLANANSITQIVTVPELNTAGASSTKRMIAFDNNIEKLSLEIPVLFEQMPQQEHGWYYTVDAHARYAGLIVYRPLSICFADGI